MEDAIRCSTGNVWKSSSGQSCPPYSSFVQVTPSPNQPTMLVASAINACDGDIITSPIELATSGQ